VKRVAIIGGGLAGLTCAYTLKRRGIDSVVFESAARPGGRSAAALYLLSPDLFRESFQLLQDLGLAEGVIPISPDAGQVYKRRIYHHRVASAAGLLSFKGLGIADKALLPRMAYLLARHSSQLDFHHPERGLDFDAETVASFVKRELSQNVLNYVAGPLISTLFYFGSDETSAWLYLVLAKHMYNTRMSTLRGGVSRIADLLSDQVGVRNGRPIRTVAVDQECYVIDGDRFSDVVIAVPGNEVLKISGMERLLADEDRKFFHDCLYQRVVTVSVLTERPLDGNCYALSIPRVENFSAATVSFHDYVDPSRVLPGTGLLTISGGGPNASSECLLDDLQKLYAVEPLSCDTSVRQSGMPKFPPGRYTEVVRFQARQRRPGLFFCGDYLLGPLIEGAIATGKRAAEAIKV
jgi:protoporphyrinogen/coproporphyrinogen III oxidase